MNLTPTATCSVVFPYFSPVLHKLSIRNYAIIEELEISFCDRMNIITGETGAGKSILLGALSLILGDRADTKVLYDEEEKCIIEADFEITKKEFKTFFEAHELDYETHTIVRREINQSGKSRAFVNDTPVTLSVLKELGEKLVNLHSQHETLDLVKSGFQLRIVDVLAKTKPLLEDYRKKFYQYKKDSAVLQGLTEQWKVLRPKWITCSFSLRNWQKQSWKRASRTC
ncbi:MAG: repair protein RecN [Bacteroidota bacterium]|nr:repair protein RecN [Bacteroidota bacterium]